MYAAGGFDFPTVSGDYSVTGLRFRPKMVVFFGSNQATVDTHLTGLTRPGLFMSVCCVDYASSSTINSYCLSIAGNTQTSDNLGYARATLPIRMQDTSGGSGIDYRANAITFDPTGFTLTVSHAATGVRPIHWWASSQFVSTTGINVGGTFSGNFPIKSGLGLSSPTSGSPTEGTTDSDSWLHFGTTHYPGNRTLTTEHVGGVCHTGCVPFTASGRQGYTQQFIRDGFAGDWLHIDLESLAAGVIGDKYKILNPDTLHGTNAVITNNGGGGIDDQQLIAWTKAEGTADFLTSSASLDDPVTFFTPSWFNEFKLIMFTTVNGANVTASETSQLRYGIGVLHEDYQGCVVFGADGSFYQSRDKMAATCTSSAAQAAVGEIQGSTFTAETVLGTGVAGIYHAFGPLADWFPQIYRRVFR